MSNSDNSEPVVSVEAHNSVPNVGAHNDSHNREASGGPQNSGTDRVVDHNLGAQNNVVKNVGSHNANIRTENTGAQNRGHNNEPLRNDSNESLERSARKANRRRKEDDDDVPLLGAEPAELELDNVIDLNTNNSNGYFDTDAIRQDDGFDLHSRLRPEGNSDEDQDTQHRHSIEEDSLRRALRYFFMNPCEKYKAKRVFPWKLVLQIIKIALVTTQLVVFGNNRSAHIDFLETTNIAFKHLYLKDWSASFEIMPYPPSVGTFAVYTTSELFGSVDYTLQQYNATEELAIGSFDFTDLNDSMVPVEMCKVQYKEGFIWAYNETFIFDSTSETVCFPLRPIINDSGTLVYDAREYLNRTNQTIDFDRLINLQLNFAIKTIHLKTKTKFKSPDCYRFDITVLYDNSRHNGQVAVSLVSKENNLACNGKVLYQSDLVVEALLLTIFDSMVIAVTVFSFILCARSLYRANQLRLRVVAWFERTDIPLSKNEQIEFINMWYVLIIINDFLTAGGSIVKMLIENKISTSYEICGLLLSSANLLVWVGVLRYLGFFEKYNVLLLTIKSAGPSVLRFLVCAAMIYLGFALCGWIVLGPYHVKFRQLSTASECLFSLINGDDIFTTFAAMEVPNAVMWWYSRLYLYMFVSLFIYVILSVFISIIMDTYDNIKSYYKNGYPKSRLVKFAEECQEDPEKLFQSSHLRGGCGTTCWEWLCNLCLPHRNIRVQREDSEIVT